MSDEEAQEERAWDLRAIDEDHANWDQWNRARELDEFAVATGAEHLPAKPGEDPLYGDQAVLARQMDTAAPYHVMEDTGAGTVPTPTAEAAPMGVGSAWGSREELLHPRDSHGRFRSSWKMAEGVVDKITALLDKFNPKT